MPKKSLQDLMYNEIKEMHGKLDKVLTEEIPELKGDIKLLKYKSGVWGGLLGLIGGILAAIGMKQ